MGSSSVLGLLFEISADPSKAQEVLANFESATSTSLKRAAGGGKELDDSILSATQSVRLLGTELGIHLPRQVTSAIAEMVPAFGGLGGVVLGVFAAEKIYDWGKTVLAQIDVAGAAAKNAVADIDEAASAAFKHAAKVAEEEFARFKDTVTGREKLADIQDRLQTLARYRSTFEHFADFQANAMDERWRIIGEAAKEGITSLDQAWTKEKEYIELQKQAREQEDKLWADKDKKNATREKQSLEAAQREAMFWQHFYEQRREAEAKQAKEAARVAQEMAKIDERHVQLLREEEMWRIEVTGETDKETKALLNEHHAMAILDKQREWLFKKSALLKQQYHETHLVVDDFRLSIEAETRAIADNQAATMAGLAAGLAGMIGGRKAAAAVETVWETAKGIACLAEGTWPPNPAAIMAAGLHFEAAAQYALMGGGAGGRRSAGGGGGSYGGSQSNYGNGGGHGFEAGREHITVVFNNSGVLATKSSLSDLAQALAPVFSQGAKSGQITLTATNSLRTGPKQTGH